MRVKPYYRVSRHDAKRGISIELQESICGQYAKAQGWQLLPALVDKGKSAFSEDWARREAFVRLLDEAQSGAFDIVLVYMLDRFSRKTVAGLRAIQILLESGVTVRSATEPIDYETPFGRKFLRDALSSAEFYSDLLGQRMKAVRGWEASQGRPIGPAPVGYRREGEKLVQTELAPAVLLLGELRATGIYSAAAIAQALNEVGYRMPDGALFKKTAVEEMFFNPLYAGLIACHGQLHPGNHEPIWTAELWARIQEVNAQRSRKRSKTETLHQPLLRGLVRCSCCGGAMWHSPSVPNRLYRCSTVLNRGGGPFSDIACCGDFAYAEEIEEQVLAVLAGLSLTPAIWADVERIAREPRPTQRALPPQELAQLKEDFLADRISAAVYEARRAALLAPQESTEQLDVHPETLLRLCEDIPMLLREGERGDVRPVLTQLVREVYARRRVVLAVRPTLFAAPLFAAAQRHRAHFNQSVCLWAEWGSNPQRVKNVKDMVLV